MNKKLVFGLGTGRCGTHSLADLFNSQKNFEVTHELGDNPVLNWAFNDECLEFYLNKITNRQSNHVGDVAFYLLPYVEAIINQFPEAKFLCLKRDRKETVFSYDKKTTGRNHWQSHDGKLYRFCPWDKCYPKYTSEKNKTESIGLYYDDYYSLVDCLIEKHPSNISLYSMDSLNDQQKVKSILEFIGVQEKDAIIKSSINIKARNN